MTASRAYIYRYSAAEERATVWFAGEDGSSASALFLELQCDGINNGLATAFHFCEPDQYTARFRLPHEGQRDKLEITYEFKGPQKDYVSRTSYLREGISAEEGT